MKYSLEIHKFYDLFKGFKLLKLRDIALEAKSNNDFVIKHFSKDGVETFAFSEGDKINNSSPVLTVAQLEDARPLRVMKNVDSRSPLSVNPNNLGIL